MDSPHPASTVDHSLGGMTVRYATCRRTGIVEMLLFPSAMAPLLAPQRPFDAGPHVDGLPARWRPQHAHEPEWLAQVKLAGTPEPGGHQVGRSMRGSADMAGFSLESHGRRDLPGGAAEIATVLRHATGYALRHAVSWRPGWRFLDVRTEFMNDTSSPLTIEYLPSFSLGGLTPFHPGEAPERLFLHRFRATWSAEGRHEARPLEELNLERSWIGFSRRTERFGQAGSLPVRQFFPWAAVEDRGAGVFWGVQLPAPGSWHIELSRCKDKVVLSGGLPSRDFGAWWKRVDPGETFATPSAILACVAGDIDDLCHALTSAQEEAAAAQPESERSLPILFNEWCSSWGEPTRDYVLDTARRLAKTRTSIFVIDDGWAQKPAGKNIQFNGDWNVDTAKFPGGLKPTCDALRAMGIVPGLWFELEAATEGTEAFAMEGRHLTLGGKTIQVGSRHFWDLRDPLTQDHLARKVIARLRDDGFGYMKIDYNDSLPEGVDGAESPGEGLRQHLEAVQAFLARVRREIPGIVIENCSSGGHRLVPAFQAICAMGSFSDAHETVAIPIIAANLHRLILPRQSQIWCVVHASDSIQRLRYGLAATFLGRMCLSGGIKDLSVAQMDEILAAQEFYAAAAPVIRDGRSRLHRHMGLSWNEPKGWQAVARHTDAAVLVVAHTFGLPEPLAPRVPLPPGEWTAARAYGTDAKSLCAAGGELRLPAMDSFDGVAVLLEGRAHQ